MEKIYYIRRYLQFQFYNVVVKLQIHAYKVMLHVLTMHYILEETTYVDRLYIFNYIDIGILKRD